MQTKFDFGNLFLVVCGNCAVQMGMEGGRKLLFRDKIEGKLPVWCPQNFWRWELYAGVMTLYICAVWHIY